MRYINFDLIRLGDVVRKIGETGPHLLVNDASIKIKHRPIRPFIVRKGRRKHTINRMWIPLNVNYPLQVSDPFLNTTELTNSGNQHVIPFYQHIPR